MPCHTTVILAQPRVPRLRAAVVYVANRARPGCRGLPRASSRIHSFQMVFLARRPPKSEFLIGYSSEKIDLSTDEIWPPFWLLMWVHGGIETKNNSFPSANATHLPRPKTTQNGAPPLFLTGIKCATFAQEGPGGSQKGGGPPV